MFKIKGYLCCVKERTFEIEETMLLEDEGRESNFEELWKSTLGLPDYKEKKVKVRTHHIELGLSNPWAP